MKNKVLLIFLTAVCAVVFCCACGEEAAEGESIESIYEVIKMERMVQ